MSGVAIPARTAMIAITTSSSTKVKPFIFCVFLSFIIVSIILEATLRFLFGVGIPVKVPLQGNVTSQPSRGKINHPALRVFI